MADVERERADKAKAVVAALQDGKLPTTAQAVKGITDIQAEGSLQDAAQGMSPAGQKILADADRLLDDTRKVVAQTMPNNELQNAIYYGNLSAKRAASRNDGLTLEQANSAANTLVQAGAKSGQLAKMIVTSGEFRSLLTDISSIVQDLVQSNVVDATDDLANDPNAPDSVRQYAAKTRDTVANNDLQDAGQQGVDSAQSAIDQGKQNLNAQAQDAKNRANAAGQDAKDAANNTRNAAGDSLAGGATLRDTAKNVVDAVADEAERRLPDDQVNQASAAIREHGAKLHTGEKSTDSYREQATAQGKAYLNQASGLANQAASQLRDPNSQVRQTGERVARKLANLPEEKKREIINKIKAVSKLIQSKPEFQTGIDDLLDVLAPLAFAAKDATEAAVEKTASIPTDPNEADASRESQIAISSAKQLVENFANGHSLDPLVRELRGLAAEAKDDDDLRAFYKDLGAYVQRTIREPGFAEKPSFERDAGDLVDRGRQEIERYSYRTANISYEARNFAQSLAANKTTQKLQKDASVLIQDLFLDEKGQPTFKPDLIKDLARCVPTIAEKLAYLPIPRIEVDDGQYHMIFDSILLRSTLLPKNIRIVTDTSIDATKQNPDDQVQSHVLLEFSHVEASARDIAWLFNKHSGFWKAGDVGLADLDAKGKGLSIRVKITPGTESGRASGAGAADDNEPKGRFLHVAEVETTLHNLDLRLHDSHHDLLYKIAKPIINKTAKKHIEQAVSDSLRDIIFSLDEKIAQAANVTGDPTGAPEPQQGIPAEWGSKAYNV